MKKLFSAWGEEKNRLNVFADEITFNKGLSPVNALRPTEFN